MSGWKGFERRCAKVLGGRRRPVTGIDRHDGDVFTDMFEIQCKVRQGQPSYLKAWLAGIVKTAAERQKIGIVIWKEAGTGFPDSEAIVVLRLADWVDLHGSVDAGTPQCDGQSWPLSGGVDGEVKPGDIAHCEACMEAALWSYDSRLLAEVRLVQEQRIADGKQTTKNVTRSPGRASLTTPQHASTDTKG